MKKLSLLLILVIALSTSTLPVYANEDISVYIDGEEIAFDTPPMMFNDRVLVPMRAIFEELGAFVEWDNSTSTIYAETLGVVFQMPIDSTTITRNSTEYTLDVPAILHNDRTYVPIRFVSETLNADVTWNGAENAVYITKKPMGYIDWNETYEYYGQVTDGIAQGYGALYDKADGTLVQMGYYENSEIIEGSDKFDEDFFVGSYNNGEMANGVYFYPNGDCYIGDFFNSQRNGEGTYYYSNNNSLSGNWVNGQIDGYCVFYDAIEDVQASGVVVDGKREGYFIFEDFALDYTYYATYVDGEVIYTSTTPYNNEEICQAYISEIKDLEQISQDLDDLYEEYLALNVWLNEEYDELLDYVKNGNPFSTDWAKDIYANYGTSSGYSPADNNLDSFAAANAMRQNAALKSKADDLILDYNETYIDNWEALIESQYKSELTNLERKKQSLLKNLDFLKQQYPNEKIYLNNLEENFLQKINVLY